MKAASSTTPPDTARSAGERTPILDFLVNCEFFRLTRFALVASCCEAFGGDNKRLFIAAALIEAFTKRSTQFELFRPIWNILSWIDVWSAVRAIHCLLQMHTHLETSSSNLIQTLILGCNNAFL
jgi:hypothetical protein